ncbi:MAG TPA: secondary thiamine-phosphate synthase enzyme YjbQ [Candidatus Sulfotelmatobacter sp.]|jgi:secondary thiamine-phosphate synthase enzyme|nr:secondary thiamine-phosphate synthase enzyme YjbQ [Candidatus Sulfotelmatobacter sp.]
MRQAVTTLHVATKGQGLYEVTHDVRRWVADQGVRTGLLTVFLRHTSASLVIQENADPDVRADLADFFARLVPDDGRLYRHAEEGPDDMPAHIKAALTSVQLSIPVVNGGTALGTWQGVYVFEHRQAPHDRSLVLHLLGE